MKFLSAILLLAACTAFAAPDEELLGKSEGYPRCKITDGAAESRCLVGMYSGFDQVGFPGVRRIANGEKVSALNRAPRAPDFGTDAYLAANPKAGTAATGAGHNHSKK